MKLVFLILVLGAGTVSEAWGQAPPKDDSQTEAGIILEKRDDCCSLKVTDSTVTDVPNPATVAAATVGKQSPGDKPAVTH